ncbi:hypothetical protein DSM03_11611 [Leeuwenhoekiella aestuarii]|nr:hypothetical protein DSM03_11611 [Leeuwenhoekiella aestuarii]
MIVTLFSIFLQDLRHRLVYWFLFPIVGIAFGILHITETGYFQFLISIAINMTVIGILLLVIYLYAKIIMKRAFFETIGLGDLLLFIALAFSFSPATFMILFVFSILFSLLFYLIILKNNKTQTIPLAGTISLFFSLILLINWIGFYDTLYLI